MQLSFTLPHFHPLRTSHATRISARRPRLSYPPKCISSAAQPDRSRDEAQTASSSVNTPPPPSPPEVTWETINGCDVVIPTFQRPNAVIRFTGGLGAGAAPRTLYGTFLEQICRRGNVAIVTTPVGITFNHEELTLAAVERVGEATRQLVARWDVPWTPTFGMGHSLGAKVQVLAGCFEQARLKQGPCVANILLSFNNFTAAQSIPVWDNLRKGLDFSTERSAVELDRVSRFLKDLDLSGLGVPNTGREGEAVERASEVLRKLGDTIAAVSNGISSGEFSPTPREVLELVETKYNVPENLIISFDRDTLDQGGALERVLSQRFGDKKTMTRKLRGTHVTPLTPSIRGQNRDGRFASVGSPAFDEGVRRVAAEVNKELDATVAVIVAYLRLHLEVLAEKKMLP